MSAAEGNGQKTCPRGGGESVQQDRSPLDARNVHAVREHGKRARTPLAAFFNIPRIAWSPQGWVFPEGLDVFWPLSRAIHVNS